MKAGVADRGDAAPAAGETGLESFVAQLHRDGVAAGQREAERLVQAAREEAAEVLRQARAEADALVATGREQLAREQERARAELELAARDTLLQLYSAITRVLEALLQRSVNRALREPDLIGGLVVEVVRTYARADAAGRPTAVQLPHTAASQLDEWTARLLAAGLAEDAEVSATLREAGFEYHLDGDGTIEVNTAAVVERLLEFLRPRLREIVAAAAGVPAQTAARERPTGTPHATL